MYDQRHLPRHGRVPLASAGPAEQRIGDFCRSARVAPSLQSLSVPSPPGSVSARGSRAGDSPVGGGGKSLVHIGGLGIMTQPQQPQQPQPEWQPPQPPAPIKKRGRWYFSRPVVGVVAALVGLMIGASGNSSTNASTATTIITTTVTAMATQTATVTKTIAPPATQSPSATSGASSSKPAPARTTAASASKAPAGPSLTGAQQQAVSAAQGYLSFQAFSRKGLIGQLSSAAGDGYSVKDATVAVDSLKVDWNAQAAKSAQTYLDMTSFSCSGLIGQLDSSAGEQFTVAQATYGAHQTSACK